MGYESKLYIGEACDLNHKEGVWVDVVATFDLCKMGHGNDFTRLLASSRTERTDTRKFFFYEGGDGHVTEDLYGEALLPLSLDDTIKVIDAVHTEGYRRLDPCLSLLRSFRDNLDQWRDLVVLHFGH